MQHCTIVDADSCNQRMHRGFMEPVDAPGCGGLLSWLRRGCRGRSVQRVFQVGHAVAAAARGVATLPHPVAPPAAAGAVAAPLRGRRICERWVARSERRRSCMEFWPSAVVHCTDGGAGERVGPSACGGSEGNAAGQAARQYAAR